MSKLILVLCASALVAAAATGDLPTKESPRAGGADLSSLRDITGIESLPPRPPTRWPYVLTITLASLAGLGIAGWKLGRRRAGAAPAPPPDRWALQELEHIESLRLPELGDGDRFHTLIADVIRSYLELRFQLQAPRRTTLEFLSALKGKDTLSERERALLRDLLQRCDLAKFAQAECSLEDCQAIMNSARTFIRGTAD